MKKILLFVVLLMPFYGAFSATDTDPIAQTKMLLDQYANRVKALEAENAILREEMRKAGIKIPLSVYSGAIATGSTTTNVINSVSTGSLVSIATGSLTSSVSTNSGLEKIVSAYGSEVAGFIKKINTDWKKIRDVYYLPKSAKIGGYELVQSGSMDHIFVDIMYDSSLSAGGIYDAKILYQYDKTTFARKLIGLFEYDKKTGYYVTKTGKNIFPGVKRIFVADPYLATNSVTPPTASTGSSNSQNSGDTGTNSSTNASNSITYADIEAAYTGKRYLSVITLSNTWLTSNTPTLDVLRIRYRTYFIIGKYTEALREVEKIKSIGQFSSAVACEGYVIATYAKDTALMESYKTTCNKK